MAPYAGQRRRGTVRKSPRIRRQVSAGPGVHGRGDDSDLEDDAPQAKKPVTGTKAGHSDGDDSDSEDSAPGKPSRGDLPLVPSNAQAVGGDDSDSDSDDSDAEDDGVGVGQGASGGKGVSIVSINQSPVSTPVPQALAPPPPVTTTNAPPPKTMDVSPPPAATSSSLLPLEDTLGAAPRPDAAQAPARIGDPTMAAPMVTMIAASSAEILTLTMVAHPTSSDGPDPRKGIQASDSTFPFIFVTSTLTPSATMATAAADSTSTTKPANKDEKDYGKIDQVGNHVLISAGSIGSFILVCFAVWLTVHLLKKSRAKKNGLRASGASSGSSGGGGWARPGLLDRVAAKLPFRGESREKGWQNLDDSGSATLSIASRTHPQSNQFYGQDAPPQLRAPSLGTGMSSIAKMPTDALNPSYPGAVSAHKQGPSFSSVDAAQFGTLGTIPPDASYGAPSAVQEPPGSYGPAWRQGNVRASEISSLSSGFGDGDIIVPGTAGKPPPRPSATATPRQSTLLTPRRASWMSQGRRDTIYTQSSEDSPARFRTISSWVDQQTGRVKRAQQRERDRQDAPPVPTIPDQLGVPGIHNPPAEQSFNMMMGDDEVPRRVQDTYGDMKS